MNPKLKELVSKLQKKMVTYFNGVENIPKNTPLSQFSSIFADGASVLDPNTSTLKKWSDYVKDKFGIETVKTTSPFGELVEEQIRQAKIPEMENAHKKMKQQYKTVGEQIQRNIEGASGKTIDELVEEEKNMTPEEVEQRNNDIADKVSEKKGKSVGETIKQYLKYLLIAAVLGGVGVFFVNLCMCQQAQLNSNCVARDPVDPSKKEIINSPNDCEYDCSKEEKEKENGCVSCCGSCTLFNLVGKDDSTKIQTKCCDHSLDKQTGSDERKDWEYNYECKNGFQQLVDTIKTMLNDLYNSSKDFFNTIWKYVVIIGVAIAAIVIINMISKFSEGGNGKGKTSPVAIGLSAAIVIAIVVWGLVTKWKFVSSW